MPIPIPIILLITDLDLGGSPLVLQALAIGLRNRGKFAPTVVSIASPKPANHQKFADKTRESDDIDAHKPQKWGKEQKIGRKLANLGDVSCIPNQLKRENIPVVSLAAAGPRDLLPALRRWTTLLHLLRPRLVLSTLVHANLLATLAQPFAPSGITYLQSIHTVQPRPHWHWIAQGLIAPFAAGHLAPSPAIIHKLLQYGPLNNPHVVPNGIDFPRFHNAPPLPTEHLPWPTHARVLGYVGRFDPVKRLDTLLTSFAQLLHNPLFANDLHLALVGYGPQDPALRSQAQQLHLTPRIHFLGPRIDVERCYKSFQVLCLPSYAEGFGLTVIEALAAGTPVVTMDTPTLRAITASFATLVSDPSPESLTSAITSVITNPPPPEPAQTWVATHFSADLMVARYEALFEKFLKA